MCRVAVCKERWGGIAPLAAKGGSVPGGGIGLIRLMGPMGGAHGWLGRTMARPYYVGEEGQWGGIAALAAWVACEGRWGRHCCGSPWRG